MPSGNIGFFLSIPGQEGILFQTLSRTWRKVKAEWEGWNRRSLADEDIVRLILDGTVVKVRLDRRATNISLLVVLGVRRDGQKLLLAVKAMDGESEAAWRAVLDDLIMRGLRTPELLLIDGGGGLERALAALWPEVPTQCCTVHYADVRIMPTSGAEPAWTAAIAA
jgi:transposase-like protein